MKVRVEKKIGKSVLSFETGFLAKQAAASVVSQYGDTVVINAVATGPPRVGIDFFPLTCDYRERTSAAGKFPGGFLKREGRPTMKETLTARLMDRPIRPLFPKWFHDEVQCQSFVMSSDRQNDADVLAMIREAIDGVEAKHDALVIGNEAENFCVGANLMMLLGVSREGRLAPKPKIGACCIPLTRRR